MRDLNYGLRTLVRDNKEGSYSTQEARHRILQQAANALHDLGYRKLKPKGLKAKHIEALVSDWKKSGLSAGTIKNRMAHLRWWVAKIDKRPIIARDNDYYNVDRRVYVTGVDKSKVLDERLERVTDPHVKMSLRLQAAFGLRREEAIKFSPSYADRGDSVVLKASWTKGGKAREIPILNQEQRSLLDEARQFAGLGAMIPANKNYIQQLNTYERNTSKAALDKMHGLRHAYAQRRYEALTGWKCPIAGGPARDTMSVSDRNADKEARLVVSRELGHERLAIVAVYIGS